MQRTQTLGNRTGVRFIQGGEPEKDVPTKLFPGSSLLASRLPAFQRQESTFVILDLVILAVLLVLHALFWSYWGNPSSTLVIVLGMGFFFRSLELVWIYSLLELPSPRALTRLTWLSIVFDLSLALSLSVLAASDNSPYYVLMMVPVLQAAFRLGALKLFGIIGLASGFTFLPVWLYFLSHPVDVLEYVETSISSLIFVIVGLLVWLLAREMREREADVEYNLFRLYQTRDQVQEEQKLAALERLSSAIASEIRDPAVRILNSIARAKQFTGPDREQILETAYSEASTLASLAADFLSYAQLQPPSLVPTSVPEAASRVVESCRARASQKGVCLQAKAPETVIANADSEQLGHALLHLVTNAIEACARGDMVTVKVYSRDHAVCVDVESPGKPISDAERSRIFEPLFTTKVGSTGLGLSIARKIARMHGGDLSLVSNEPQRICFSMTLQRSEPYSDPKSQIRSASDFGDR